MIATQSTSSTWKHVVCQDVIDVRDGTHDTPAQVVEGIPLITSKNLKPEGIDFEDVSYISEADYLEIEKRSGVDDGDVLFAMIGTIGNPVIVRKDRRFSIKNVALFKLKGSPVLPAFFKSLLSTEIIRRQLDSALRGGNQKFVSLNVLRNLVIPLPPLVEQRRIAEVLGRAEALRAKRRAALAQLDSLTQSIFLDLFGDTRKERIRWQTAPLEGIVRETKLGLVRGSQKFGPEFPIPYVRMNAITRNGELELAEVQRTHATKAEIEAYRLEPGDFLFNTRNSEELVGKTALYRGGGLHLFNNNVMRIRFTAEADPEFVAAAFKTAFVQHELNLRKSGTTNVFAIYYKDLRSLPLPLPPIALQREFARRVGAVEKLKTAQRASMAEMDALFASLQHRAFRGEL